MLRIVMIWLHASKETRFARVITRGEEGDTEDFLKHVESTLAYPWPLVLKQGIIFKIETDELSPDEVLKETQSALEA